MYGTGLCPCSRTHGSRAPPRLNRRCQSLADRTRRRSLRRHWRAAAMWCKPGKCGFLELRIASRCHNATAMTRVPPTVCIACRQLPASASTNRPSHHIPPTGLRTGCGGCGRMRPWYLSGGLHRLRSTSAFGVACFRGRTGLGAVSCSPAREIASIYRLSLHRRHTQRRGGPAF